MAKTLILTIMCRINGVYESKISTCLAFASLHHTKKAIWFCSIWENQTAVLSLENRSSNKDDKPPYANSKDWICNK